MGVENDKWPMLERLWDLFSAKGIKTVFMSVGAGESALLDLEIAETLGCPLHIFEVRESVLKQWDDVQAILKSRKAPEVAAPFTNGVESKWVLPKNIRVHKELPSFFTGTAVLENVSYPTKDIASCVKDCINSMNLKEENMRIDLLKICLGNEYEIPILEACLAKGFRPGLLMIEWTNLPDENLASCITAGHLQTCGYTLLGHYGNRFLYLANDKCMYEICSWQMNGIENPMVNEIVKHCALPENISPE